MDFTRDEVLSELQSLQERIDTLDISLQEIEKWYQNMFQEKEFLLSVCRGDVKKDISNAIMTTEQLTERVTSKLRAISCTLTKYLEDAKNIDYVAEICAGGDQDE